MSKDDIIAKLRAALENANSHAGKIMAITNVPNLYRTRLEDVRHHAVEIGWVAAETLDETGLTNTQPESARE